MSPRPFADRRERRRQKRLFVLVIAVLAVYLFFVGDHRPHHLALLYVEEKRNERRIEELRTEHAELMLQREDIESDAFTLEKLARDKGMIRPGDIVYRIVPVPEDTDDSEDTDDAEPDSLDGGRND